MPAAASRSDPAMRSSASPSRMRKRQTDAWSTTPSFQSRVPIAPIHRPSGDQAGAPQLWRPRPGERRFTRFVATSTR